ncbi:MAG: signal peptidase II [Bacteroidetes bacterium]|nr:signal peptidase II [Bacteroidota bacterium]
MHAIANRAFLLAAFLIVIDQITKVWVHTNMFLGESFPLVGEAIRCTYVQNPGMAFGISFGAGKILLTLFTIVISVLLAWYLRRLRSFHPLVRIAVMLIFAGAVGNLIDRMFYGVIFGEDPLMFGKVVDFIQVDIPDVSWFGEIYTHYPVFNIADACVSCGVVLLIVVSKYMPTAAELKHGAYLSKEQHDDGTNNTAQPLGLSGEDREGL